MLMNSFLKYLTLVIFFSIISCSEVEEEVDGNDSNSIGNSTIWEGSPMTFEKADGSDPNDATNQDRITNLVWITRGNGGGQIYNIAKENSSNKDNSPAGTLWAVGKLDQIESLNFTKFRAAVGKPQDVVGKDLVMYMEEDDIYLSIRFTSWSNGQKGGFAYTRSTSN